MTYLPGFENPIGYIKGVRQWAVYDNLLNSVVVADYLWEPWKVVENVAAVYGIHAAKPEHESLLEYERYPCSIVITGRVALWGKVIEHEKGYRAQYAYPLTLDHCNDRHLDLDELREIYLQPPTDKAQIIVRERIKCRSEKRKEPSLSNQSPYPYANHTLGLSQLNQIQANQLNLLRARQLSIPSSWISWLGVQ